MSVRAKFKVTSINRNIGSVRTKDEDGKDKWIQAEVQTVKLSPVTSGSPENESFYAASPSGSIELGCVNPAANEQFVLEGEYYIDFTKAS